MFYSMFSGIFDTDLTSEIAIGDFMLCMIFALFAGLILAFTYSYKNTYTKSFVVTLATLPAIVCMVIMMVNGNVGTGVAVAGVFSLVRFRSVPGTAREIGAIFIAMSAGLVLGMGYIAYGVIFTAVLAVITHLYNSSSFGENNNCNHKTVTVTIPEDLNYIDVFDDLMKKYTVKNNIVFVKTTNMGSLFKITYDIEFKEVGLEKSFIDEMRTRNGNLEITISPTKTNVNEL